MVTSLSDSGNTNCDTPRSDYHRLLLGWCTYWNIRWNIQRSPLSIDTNHLTHLQPGVDDSSRADSKDVPNETQLAHKLEKHGISPLICSFFVVGVGNVCVIGLQAMLDLITAADEAASHVDRHSNEKSRCAVECDWDCSNHQKPDRMVKRTETQCVLSFLLLRTSTSS